MPKINSSYVTICESSRPRLARVSLASHPKILNCYPRRSTFFFVTPFFDHLGDDYATWINLYNLSFRMVFFFLILRYIKKWPLTGGAGWWMAERDDFKRGFWSRVEIPTRMQIFCLLIFVYKLISTNSYILWRLYQFVLFYVIFYTNSYIFYTNCIVRIHTTSRAGEARAHLLPRPGRTRLPRR